MPTRRHTTLDLDPDLLDAAAAVLGTAGTTETVHVALRAVVARGLRVRLAARDFTILKEHLPALRAVERLPER